MTGSAGIAARTPGQHRCLVAAAWILAGMMLMLAPPLAGAAELFPEDAYVGYKANLDNGKYMFNASGCGACHGSGDNTELLSGGLEMETAIGKFFAPNISADSNGIGGWSNATFLNAVMNGIDKDGDHLYPVMPYTSYGGLNPDDVLDIKAYIEKLPKSDAVSKDNEVAFPFSRQTTITLWKRSHFTVAAYQPKDRTQMERGRYLVENAGACGDCHTPRTTTYGLDTEHAFEGEKGLTGAVAPDITKARMAGLPSPEVFTTGLIEDGKKLGGAPISDPVMRRIATGLSQLSEDDRNAIYAYLADRAVQSTPVATSTAAVCTESNAGAALSGTNAALAQSADAFIGKYCRNCHGAGEGSQGSYPAGDLASIAANAAFVTPGNAEKSRLYTSVTSGRMPLGKRPSDDEVKALGDWINGLGADTAIPVAAASPERTRPMLAAATFTEAALKDLSAVASADRPYQRYFSYRSQYNGMMGCEEDRTFMKRLPILAGGFKKLLNSLSYAPQLVLPKAVDGTEGLLVRVDLRDLDWSAADYDFLVREYFYGIDPDSDPLLSALSRSTGSALPIMRIDWFMSNAARPKIYNYLMRLPAQIADLESRFGIDVNDNIRRLKVVRAGFADGSSGVSDHNRMLERHDMPAGGYYWKSYDFAGDRGRQVLKRFPHGPKSLAPLDTGLEPFEHDGGEMIFALPNGLQGYYLSTATGKQIDVGPTTIVSFRKRPIGKGVEITNARSCFDCHANGILSKRDQLREHIQTSTLFDTDQRDLLLKLYVGQDKLDQVYDKDRQRFVTALKTLGVTEPTPDGSAQSMQAPANAELVTYFADKYEEELDFDAVAAEFDMTPKQFEAAAKRIADGPLLRIVIDWIATLEAGGTIPRIELESQYAYLLEPMLGLKPLVNAVSYDASATAAATPDYRAEDKPGASPVQLALNVDSTTARVGDQLSFKLSTNTACELQILYVEEGGHVEVIPDVMLGNTTLSPGEQRLIPQPGTGNLTFDTPAADETMLALCRVGGLGDTRLTAEKAQQLVAQSHQPTTRGLAINLAEKAQKDDGASGLQMVTFEIRD